MMRLKKNPKHFFLIFKTRYYCSTALLLTLPSLSTPANCPVAILILSGWTARLRQTEIWLAFAVIGLQNWEVFCKFFFLSQQKPMKTLMTLNPKWDGLNVFHQTISLHTVLMAWSGSCDGCWHTTRSARRATSTCALTNLRFDCIGSPL